MLRTIKRMLPLPGSRRPFVPVVELSGVIAAGGSTGRRGLSLASIESVLDAAFSHDEAPAVALLINSPGGSPVQSRLIYGAIRRLARHHEKRVIAFVEDVAASGGYILALAADEIYADSSSIVGSIGVVSAGFGFQEAMARAGIERRVYTAGEAKSQLDPFRAEQAGDVERLRVILDDLHGQFIALVTERRGAALKDPGDVFSGAFWTAAAAGERGLIDGTAQFGDFLRAAFGENVNIRRYTSKQSPLRRLFGGGAAAAAPPLSERREAAEIWGPDAWLDALEARSIWSRYGL